MVPRVASEHADGECREARMDPRVASEHADGECRGARMDPRVASEHADGECRAQGFPSLGTDYILGWHDF